MAKVKLGNLSPGATPLVRGGFYIRDTRWGPIAQAWPKKRGKATEGANLWAQKKFGIAGVMAANPFWLDYLTAVHMVKETTLVPRDWLMMCAYGKAYEIQMEDGTFWPSRVSVTVNPQLILDDISSDHGAMLYRDTYGWVGLDPGSQDYVLTMDAGMPAWKPPGGGTGLGTLVTTLYRTTDATPTNSTTHICEFEAAAVDENNLWDPANPTRLYFPATANRVRLSCSVYLTAAASAQPHFLATIDDTTSTTFLGSLRETLYPNTVSSVVRQLNVVGPWVPLTGAAYCQLRLQNNINVNEGFLTNSSITIEVA